MFLKYHLLMNLMYKKKKNQCKPNNRIRCGLDYFILIQ